MLSAELGKSLKDDVKNAALTLSKFNRTKVARATMVEDNEIVDLIVDRVVRPFKVDLLPNGRPDPISIFAGLAKAKDESGPDLKAFFHP